MKTTFFLFAPLLVALILVGCSGWEDPVQIAERDALDQLSAKQGPSFIPMPKSNSLQKLISVTELITPQNGGTLRLNYENQASNVFVNISLKFPSGAVSNNTYVTMTIDDAVLMTNIDLSFGPSMSFLKPGYLDVNTQGLDLSAIPANAQIKLYYDNKGVWEEIANRRITVDLSLGQLKCKDGEIPHFSRYAFGF